MRLLGLVVAMTCSLSLGHASAQDNRVSPAAPEQPIAAEVPDAPRIPPSGPLVNSKVLLGDAWVTFEQQRDQRTQRGERVFFPLSLALQTGVGVGLAVVADDASVRSRALLGVSGGLAAAALLPTIISGSRDARRAWFGIGSAAFTLGLGVSLLSLASDHENNEDNPSHGAERYMGAAVALQGLALLPIGLMRGFPDSADYEAYFKLPLEARPDAAARLLMQIDRYEQRVTGAIVLSNIVMLAVLGLGAVVNSDREERQALGAVAVAPLVTSLLTVPRMFIASRNERFTRGQAPSRLGFNAW